MTVERINAGSPLNKLKTFIFYFLSVFECAFFPMLLISLLNNLELELLCGCGEAWGFPDKYCNLKFVYCALVGVLFKGDLLLLFGVLLNLLFDNLVGVGDLRNGDKQRSLGWL